MSRWLSKLITIVEHENEVISDASLAMECLIRLGATVDESTKNAFKIGNVKRKKHVINAADYCALSNRHDSGTSVAAPSVSIYGVGVVLSCTSSSLPTLSICIDSTGSAGLLVSYDVDRAVFDKSRIVYVTSPSIIDVVFDVSDLIELFRFVPPDTPAIQKAIQKIESWSDRQTFQVKCIIHKRSIIKFFDQQCSPVSLHVQDIVRPTLT